MAARRVCGQRQQISGGQGAQAAEELGALLELGQRLDQPGAVVTDGGQWDLGEDREKLSSLYHLPRVNTVPGKLSPNGEICLVRFIYLRLCAALCCVRVVVHLVGEQGHEEREAADVPRSRLSTVERLRVNRSTRFLLLLN